MVSMIQNFASHFRTAFVQYISNFVPEQMVVSESNDTVLNN